MEIRNILSWTWTAVLSLLVIPLTLGVILSTRSWRTAEIILNFFHSDFAPVSISVMLFLATVCSWNYLKDPVKGKLNISAILWGLLMGLIVMNGFTDVFFSSGD